MAQSAGTSVRAARVVTVVLAASLLGSAPRIWCGRTRTLDHLARRVLTVGSPPSAANPCTATPLKALEALRPGMVVDCVPEGVGSLAPGLGDRGAAAGERPGRGGGRRTGRSDPAPAG
ncbi:hypothetical protein [Streptomyces sp. NPDC001508]|uniref:hypothetical protein n=1 Tax=Streptomyces sp. NPDC001508 TaxID=3154656 RepID=UPI00332B8568